MGAGGRTLAGAPARVGELARGGDTVDAAVRARMSRQPRRDTKPEIALRRELHRRGMRFRVDLPLPGMPRRRGDVVFTRARVAVFVDGCFWHSCPEHATVPATRREWWVQKLSRNVKRDRDTDRRLREQDWVVLRFWEHEDPIAAATVVESEVRRSRHGRHDGRKRDEAGAMSRSRATWIDRPDSSHDAAMIRA